MSSTINSSINKVLFSDSYAISPSPNALLKDTKNGALNKFGSHLFNRQNLIESIAHDLTDKYNML